MTRQLETEVAEPLHFLVAAGTEAGSQLGRSTRAQTVTALNAGVASIATLTDAATIAVDWSAFYNAQVTITDDRTLGLPTNGQPGTWRSIDVIQDGTGGHVLSFASGYHSPQGIAPLVPVEAGARTKLSLFCRTTEIFEVFWAYDVKAIA